MAFGQMHNPPYKTCPRCGLGLHSFAIERHVGKIRCLAEQESTRLRALGLHLAKLRWQNKSDHTAEALRLFGLDVELHATGLHGGLQPWTSEEGVSLALIIEYAARLLGISYPEAARRMNDHRELMGPFGVALMLGSPQLTIVHVSKLLPGDSPDDLMLREILAPIDYVLGSDGKRRKTQR